MNLSINQESDLSILNKTSASLSSASVSSNDLDNNSLEDDYIIANNNKNTNRENNFSNKNTLKSIDHSFTGNQRSSYTSYFYTNTKTILNKFVMSYEEQLHKAITKGNYDLCSELIKRNCDVNKSFNRKYPLCLACEHNYFDLVELLIKSGADVNQFDYYDQSCLIYAVSCADLDIVELLLRNGADVNKCDSNGIYPLHLALHRQNDEICDLLLKYKPHINAIDKQGNTPLATAISNDYFYMVEKLLSLQADPNLSDNNGDTPLIKAIWATMNSSVDKNEISKTVIKLVESGADIDARNETGRTALFTAIYQNNTEIALYLIEKGASCHLEDALMSNFTLLHYACFQGNYTLTKALLEKKCDPNLIAASCESPVYIAVTKGYLDIVSLLIEYGADVNLSIGTAVDTKCTALQAAIYYISDYEKFKKIVDKLIDGNADLSIAIPGPIIYICLQYNKINFAKYLISCGSDITQRTVFNQSAFYRAFLNKNLEFMQLCVMAGFNLKEESWINSYIENPDFIEYTDFYVRKATSPNSSSSEDDNSDLQRANELQSRTDQEIADLLNLDEYFFERFHLNNRKKKLNKEKCTDLAMKIYQFISHYNSNPLSLKELARIKIRKHLLSIDYKMKNKVEKDLELPKKLKDYLLFKEFNL